MDDIFSPSKVTLNIVAFDTSTETLSVALLLNEKILEQQVRAGNRHSELLLPMLHELLQEADKKLSDFSGIAFGAGPGSFTGLRIACGVAQGLALGMGLPVVGVSTLLALAQASGAHKAVCCLDARMNEVYHAAYVKQGATWITIHEPSLCKPQDVPKLDEGGWTACGNGFVAQKDILLERYARNVDTIRSEIIPHAKEIANLALSLFQRGEGVTAEQAAPVYIRDKVALRMDER
jgi:tRNA threonylcarbamoyladenosine biosynthesis protein TsaB